MKEIKDGINKLVELSHTNAVEKGFYDTGDFNIPEKLMLIVSEVSEALEDYRKLGDSMDLRKEKFESKVNGFLYDQQTEDVSLKPVGFPSELADVIIRVCDLAGRMNFDLGQAVVNKIQFNFTRPYRHGGKKA